MPRHLARPLERQARERKPDLILLDINLPGIDGIAARGELKRDPATADIPVIAVTGGAMLHERQRYDDAGFDGILAKPFRLAEIRALFTG